MLDSNELFKKWTKSVFFLAISFTIWIILGELLNYRYSNSNYIEEMTLKNYFLSKMLIPIIINSLVIIISYGITKIKKISIAKKAVIPIITISLISFCFMFFHHDSPLSILSLAIPIILSILYSDSRLAKTTAIMCGIISFLITIILLHFNYSMGYSYIINLCAALIFLLAFTTTAYIMADLEVKKNELLKTSIIERNLYHEKSIIDELTKCYNRTSYEETIEKKFKKHNKMVLSVIDLDHFKNVNDTYGHLAGDIVLQRFGKLINTINSDEVYVARYGGEEFVIVFYNHTIEKAQHKIAKLHNKFSAIAFEELENTSVTFSCGMAKKEQNDTSESLFGKADNALYKAKDTGRNKTVVYS